MGPPVTPKEADLADCGQGCIVLRPSTEPPLQDECSSKQLCKRKTENFYIKARSVFLRRCNKKKARKIRKERKKETSRILYKVEGGEKL